MENTKKPVVVIAVAIEKDGKALMGKRISKDGNGEYGFPGGKLDFGESFERCALREVAEECGLQIGNLQLISIGSTLKYTEHYIPVVFSADWKDGEPEVLEPEKCESWDWYDLDNLPKPLSEPCRFWVEAKENRKNLIDLGK